MPKCEVCQGEVLFPFVCSYCHGSFCAEHQLPENHQCPLLPKDPRFWYLKKKFIEDRLAIHKVGACPECYSLASDMIHYDAKTMTFECKECGHKWTQLKEYPHRIIETKEEQKPELKEQQKLKKRIIKTKEEEKY